LATLKYSKTKGKSEPLAAKKEAKTTKIKTEAIGTNAMIGNRTAKGVLDLDSLSFAQVFIPSTHLPLYLTCLREDT